MARRNTTPPGDGRPVLLYDGQCPFCTRQARRLEARAGGRMAVLSSDGPGVLRQFPGITDAECRKEMKVVSAEGTIRGGAEALLYALEITWRIPGLSAAYRIPGLRLLADLAYAAVARNRYRLFGRASACEGDVCRRSAPPAPGVSGTAA